VQNAVDHGLTPEHTGTISARLSINEENQLNIDVSDPNPHFPAFEAAVRGERGRGLWDVQRLRAEVTWFRPPNRNSSSRGKTVRATLTDGTVPAARCDR